MATRIIGVFPGRDEVETAVQALLDHNVPQETISVVVPNAQMEESGEPQAAEVGGKAITAGTLGMVGLTSLIVPGIGPLLAAGPLVAAAGMAASVGAHHVEKLSELEHVLTAHGLSEPQARAYAQRLNDGQSILAVDLPDDRLSIVAEVLHEAGGTGLDYRPVESDGRALPTLNPEPEA